MPTTNPIAIYTLLDAGNDQNGNPRRLYRITMVTDTHITTTHVLAGYHGKNIVNIITVHTNTQHDAGTIRITPKEYRRLLPEANTVSQPHING